MTKWVISSILSLLFQYWVYTTFWISVDDVTQVSRVKHISGELESIQCVDIKRGGFTRVKQRFDVKILNSYSIDFEDEGTVNNCEEFYTKFEAHFSPLNEIHTETRSTLVGEKLYSVVSFDGYFIGRRPMQVQLNDYQWMRFDEIKIDYNRLVVWISLTQVFIMMVVMAGWYRNK